MRNHFATPVGVVRGIESPLLWNWLAFHGLGLFAFARAEAVVGFCVSLRITTNAFWLSNIATIGSVSHVKNKEAHVWQPTSSNSATARICGF